MRVGDITEAHGKRYIVTRVEHGCNGVNVYVREIPTEEGIAALRALVAEWEAKALALHYSDDQWDGGERVTFRECAAQLKAKLGPLTQTTQTTE